MSKAVFIMWNIPQQDVDQCECDFVEFYCNFRLKEKT